MRHSLRDTEILYRSGVPPAVQLPPELLLKEFSAIQPYFLGLPDDLPDAIAEMIEDRSERHDRGEEVSTLIMSYERENGKKTMVVWSPPGGQDHLALENRARQMGREDIARLINEQSRTIVCGGARPRR